MISVTCRGKSMGRKRSNNNNRPSIQTIASHCSSIVGCIENGVVADESATSPSSSVGGGGGGVELLLWEDDDQSKLNTGIRPANVLGK